MPVLNMHIVVFTGFKCVYQYANTKPGDMFAWETEYII